MAKTIVTQQAVSDLANQMLSDGKAPSIISLQQVLGGSNTTIKKYLDYWQQERQMHAEHVAAVPDDIAKRGQQFVAELWRSAHRLTQQEIEVLHEKSSQEKRQDAQRLQEVLEALDQAQAEVEEVTIVREKQTALLAVAERRIAVLEAQMAEAADLKHQLAKTQARLRTVEDEYLKLQSSHPSPHQIAEVVHQVMATVRANTAESSPMHS